jgi:hypothetical protein
MLLDWWQIAIALIERWFSNDMSAYRQLPSSPVGLRAIDRVTRSYLFITDRLPTMQPETFIPLFTLKSPPSIHRD